MLAGGDRISKEQLDRIHGCIRIILKQIYGYSSGLLFEDFKVYIKLLSCEEGYPYTVERGCVLPKSFAHATQAEGNIVNTIINRYADENNLVLIQTDEQGKYPSLHGRDRETMIREYPELYKRWYGE